MSFKPPIHSSGFTWAHLSDDHTHMNIEYWTPPSSYMLIWRYAWTCPGLLACYRFGWQADLVKKKKKNMKRRLQSDYSESRPVSGWSFQSDVQRWALDPGLLFFLNQHEGHINHLYFFQDLITSVIFGNPNSSLLHFLFIKSNQRNETGHWCYCTWTVPEEEVVYKAMKRAIKIKIRENHRTDQSLPLGGLWCCLGHQHGLAGVVRRSSGAANTQTHSVSEPISSTVQTQSEHNNVKSFKHKEVTHYQKTHILTLTQSHTLTCFRVHSCNSGLY